MVGRSSVRIVLLQQNVCILLSLLHYVDANRPLGVAHDEFDVEEGCQSMV
jgi:hypothetical protein